MKKLLLILSMSIVTGVSYAGSTYLDVKGGLNTSDYALGVAGDIGYSFNNYFGVEAGYTDSFTNNNSSWADAAVRGTLPLTDSFALYGRAGYALKTSGWGDSSGALLGAGAEFSLSRQWKLDVEDYDLTNGPNFVMAGAKFNF